MKLTKSKLKQIIKEELTKIVREEAADPRDAYEKFVKDYSWKDTGKEAALIAFGRSPERPRTEKGILDYAAMAELYKEYIAPTQEAFYTRKAEVADELAQLRSGERKDTKPYMGSEDRHEQKNLERKIEYLEDLQGILNELPPNETA
jgi:hypothetical protein